MDGGAVSKPNWTSRSLPHHLGCSGYRASAFAPGVTRQAELSLVFPRDKPWEPNVLTGPEPARRAEGDLMYAHTGPPRDVMLRQCGCLYSARPQLSSLAFFLLFACTCQLLLRRAIRKISQVITNIYSQNLTKFPTRKGDLWPLCVSDERWEELERLGGTSLKSKKEKGGNIKEREWTVRKKTHGRWLVEDQIFFATL